jgi:TatD DNase family protein
MILIDSHAHLNMLATKDDLAAIIARAEAANVGYIQTICTKLDELDALLKISDQFPNVFVSAGVHPNEVAGAALTSSAELIELAKHPKIIGLGETGLDYYYQTSDKDLQIKSFEEHIIAAQTTKLPVIVHTREAEDDTASIIGSYMKLDNFPGLIHCFTASKEFAGKMLDLGFYISFSGIITFKNAEALREIVKFVPMNRILIETDSPYLAPIPMRGKTNEPAYVAHVAKAVADIKSIKIEEVASATSQNFFTLFAKSNN